MEGHDPKHIQVKRQESICKAKMSLGGKYFSLEYRRSVVLRVRRHTLALAGVFGKFWTYLHFCFLFYKVDNVNILKNKYYDSVNVANNVFLHLALYIFMRYHFKTRTSTKTYY